MSDQAPDYAGPVIMWRAWVVDQTATLRSMAMYGETWDERPKEAECMDIRSHRLGRVSDHEAPYDICRCGIYALDTLEDLLDEPTQVRRVLYDNHPYFDHMIVTGQVEVWGNSVRYSFGRRVQFAQVRSLAIPALINPSGITVREVADGLGVPVTVESEIHRRKQEVAELMASMHESSCDGRHIVLPGACLTCARIVNRQGHASTHVTYPSYQAKRNSLRKAGDAARNLNEALNDLARRIRESQGGKLQ